MFKFIPYAFLLGCLVQAGKVFGQIDTSNYYQLNEITVQSSPGKDQIGFYQSSKLSTTEEILSRMEGVNLIRRGAYGMEPTLRNYSANQITLSIDGMRMYGACPDKMDPISIYVEPINLQTISAAHGAQGNFVGGGIGGNINLSFKTPATLCHPQFLAQVVQSYSSNNNAVATSFAIEQAGAKQGFRLSGTYRKAGDYFAPNGKVRYSAYEKLNVSAAYQIVLDSNQQIRFSYLGDWGRNIGYPALPMDVGLANTHVGSISYLYSKPSGILRLNETKIYANDIYHEMDDTQRDFVPMHMDMPSWSRTFGAYNESNLLYKRHQAKVRVDAHQNSLRADMTMYPNNNDPIMFMQTLPNSIIQNTGLALQYQYEVKVNYQMRFHARLDYFKQYAEPSIGAESWLGFNQNVLEQKKDFTKSFSWIHALQHKNGFKQNITAGYAERIASSNERYGFYLFIPMDGFDYLGNPDLAKEKSWQLEYTLRQEKGRLAWSVQPFYHLTQDYIYTQVLADYAAMTIGARGVKSYKNIDYAFQTGAEASLQWRLADGIQYRGNLRYIYAETLSGTPLPLVSPLKYQQVLRAKWSEFQLQLEHVLSAAQNRINTDFNERKTPAFHLVHIRSNYSLVLNKHTIQIAAAIENVFNTYYFEHTDILYLPRMGRNFNFSIGYIFR